MMSQKVFTRFLDRALILQFVQAVDWFFGCHWLPQSGPESIDDISRRVDTEMAARDPVKQSGERLAKMLEEKNHAAACEDVLKVVYYIAEGGDSENAYVIWPDLRAHLKRFAAEAVTTKSKHSTERGRPPKHDQESDQRRIADWKVSGMTLREFAEAKKFDLHELELTRSRVSSQESRARKRLSSRTN